MTAPLLRPAHGGLYCEAGDFYIDPKWPAVETALITHGHSDHARSGHGRYYCARPGLELVRRRVKARKDDEPAIEGVAFGEPLRLGPVTVSFHPAGHLLGSAQIRVELDGEVWVVTGDYKRDDDPTCRPFEPVPCDVLITEATFGLPIYRWQPTAEVVAEIYAWWQENAAADLTSVLFCYSLGKAQRVLAELLHHTDEEVLVHGAMVEFNDLYEEAGVPLVPTRYVTDMGRKADFTGRLVLAPPSAFGTSWMRRFKPYRTGFASGWMRIRGNRRRRGFDAGFALSDHIDWHDLLRTIDDTGPRRVLATHGDTAALIRYLREERGLDAWDLLDAYKPGGPYA